MLSIKGIVVLMVTMLSTPLLFAAVMLNNAATATTEKAVAAIPASVAAPKIVVNESVRFLRMLNYPACRDLEELLDYKQATRTAYEGTRIFDEMVAASYNRVKFDITADFYQQTRCMFVPTWSRASGELKLSDQWYPVVQMPQPSHPEEADIEKMLAQNAAIGGRTALCIIFGTKITREQPCSWVLIDSVDIERRPEM